MMLKLLGEYFAKNNQKYGIIYTIVFGTAVTNYFREDSDIDIGVMFLENTDENKLVFFVSEIIYDLEELTKREIDVCDISKAHPGLKYEIFTKGKLIFCMDRAKYLDDKTNAIMEYLDVRYLTDFHFRRIFRDAISRTEKQN